MANNLEVDFNAIFNVLASSKEAFWAENAQLTEEERQRLWNDRFGQMASQLCGPAQASQLQILTSRKQMGRTLSVSIPPAKRPALDPELHQPVDLRRHASTSAAVNMSRKASSKSRRPTGPFSTEAAPISPLSMPSPRPYVNEVRPSPQIRHQPRQSSIAVDEIQAQSFSPQEFLSKMTPDSSCSPSVSFTPATTTGTVSSTPSLQHPVPYHIYTDTLEPHAHLSSPSTAVSEAMTRSSTIATEAMSRVATNEMICSPLDMLRIKSNVSADESPSGDAISKSDDLTSVFHHDSFPTDSLFPQVDHSFAPDVSLFPSSPFFDQSFLSSSPLANLFSPSNNGSLSSSSSSKSRASRRTQEQIASASRPIAPKMKEEEIQSSSTARVVRVSSADGKMKEVAQIPKTPYNRPAKPKTFCSQCNDQPEGFHGDHELRRHIERVHATVRKVWVCRDISPDQKFLANCKACRNGKTYGANYNAAAHLRRTHFHPCKKGRGGRGKPSEKRGGKGGGDHPPMEELKHWMVQTEERVPIDGINHSLVNSSPLESDQDEDSLTNEIGNFDNSYTLESYDSIDSTSSDNIPRQSASLGGNNGTDYNFDPAAYSFLDHFSLENYLNTYTNPLDLQATAVA